MFIVSGNTPERNQGLDPFKPKTNEYIRCRLAYPAHIKVIRRTSVTPMSSGRMNRRRGPRFDGGRDDSRIRFDRDLDPDRTEPGDPRRVSGTERDGAVASRAVRAVARNLLRRRGALRERRRRDRGSRAVPQRDDPRLAGRPRADGDVAPLYGDQGDHPGDDRAPGPQRRLRRRHRVVGASFRRGSGPRTRSRAVRAGSTSGRFPR